VNRVRGHPGRHPVLAQWRDRPQGHRTACPALPARLSRRQLDHWVLQPVRAEAESGPGCPLWRRRAPENRPAAGWVSRRSRRTGLRCSPSSTRQEPVLDRGRDRAAGHRGRNHGGGSERRRAASHRPGLRTC
jgi:hypothetical protein